MRNAFADELTTLARRDERIVLLSGDIGNKLFDSFKNVDEHRFFNCGIAEANMMGVAAGMALSGLRPVVYTIAAFATTRCFEQIRVDACYHKTPVIIVGTGAGLSYAELGPTHHTLEDLAILRTLPGMRVLAPCDAAELRALLRLALQEDGPVYIRIGKKGEPAIYAEPPRLRIGTVSVIRAGRDLCLLSTGTLMAEVLKAADLLAGQGIAAEVVSVHSVKPLDQDYLRQAGTRFRLLVTVEEHSRIGGLGGALAEWRAEQRLDVPQLCFGTDDAFMHEVGGTGYALTKYGLTAENIAARVAVAIQH